MKNLSKIFVALFCLAILSACQTPWQTNQTIQSEKSKTEIGEKVIDTAETQTGNQLFTASGSEDLNRVKEIVEENHTDTGKNINPYLKWKVPIEKFNHLDSSLAQKKDCIGFDLAYGINEGDLLSSLIIDDEARNLINLKVYTKEYVKNLEQRIVRKTHAVYDSDFYASYLCHFGDGFDITAGKILPKGASEFVESGKSAGNIKFGKSVFIIIYKNNIYTYQNIRLIGMSATGAEPPYCNGILENNKLIWGCFMGLYKADNANEDVIGNRWKKWEISLDNGDVITSEGASKF